MQKKNLVFHCNVAVVSKDKQTEREMKHSSVLVGQNSRPWKKEDSIKRSELRAGNATLSRLRVLHDNSCV